MRLALNTLAVLVVAACGGQTASISPGPTAAPTASTVGTAPEPTVGPSSSASVSPTVQPSATLAPPTVTPTSTPSATPDSVIQPIEVVRWSVARNAGATQTLYIELFNPNQTLGLLRAEFSLAVIAEDQSVIAVLGQGGVPGSYVSTIYQLPPNGTYGFDGDLPRRAPPIDHLEVTVPDHQWMDWFEVNPPPVEVIEPTLGRSFGYPIVTGRIEVDVSAEGPFNVFVTAFVERGTEFVIPRAFVDCAQPGQAQAFQADVFSRLRRGTLTKAVAYVTTVPGVPGSVDGSDSPPGC